MIIAPSLGNKLNGRSVNVSFGIWSCVPIIVLIIGALTTKRMVETLIVSSLIGTVIIYHQHFFTGFVGLIYDVLSDDTYQFALILIMSVGAMMKLFERSGALHSFRKKLSKYAYTRKRSLLITWLLSIILFIDDYLILLTVSMSMKNLTDKTRVPREHLAYTLNAMSVSVCLIIPFTSWSVFAITNMKKLGLDLGDYLHAIPYMFFSLASVLISLLLILGVIPKLGQMKKAYKRVDSGGSLVPVEEENGASIVSVEEADGNDAAEMNGSLIDFIIPMACLLIVMMLCGRNIIYGIVAALFCMLFLYKIRGIMTVGEFFACFYDGMREMSTIAFVVLFAYMIAHENDLMGFAPYIVTNCVKIITPRLLPLFIFMIMSLVAFTIGDVWALILIAMPIFIPMAQKTGLNPSIAVGALLSGANFGATMCLQSDALFMTYAGTGVPNVTQIKAALPYVAMAVLISCAGYLIVGLT